MDKKKSKRDLRRLHLEERIKIPADLRAAAAEKIHDLFFDHVKMQPGTVIAGYWPVRGEVDDMPVLRTLLQRNCPCALPCVVGEAQPLMFRSWTPETPMETGKYDIPEPAAGQMLSPDIILVPMVSFDDKGHRLGYGGGFYDRTLAALKRARQLTVVGVAYESQRCVALPAGEKDVRMDMIVTDKGVYTFGGQP